MAQEQRSLQDLIRSRQRSGFVGRRGQVTQYEENLALDVDDERRRFLFNIHGNAGVGKTYLTVQLRETAAARAVLTAYIDETVDDVLSAMSTIARQLSQVGVRLGEFDKRAAAYLQRRHELASDPHAPDGVAAFLTRTAVVIGLQAAGGVPIVGGLLAPVDAAAAADQAERARAYLASRLRDHDDVRLLLSPTEELTPLFVAGLNRAAERRPIALFIDTYERTGPLLDRWLRDMYAGRYGNLPGTLITTISGQVPLDSNTWSDYLPVIADVPLEPFSDTEARQFLVSKDITDEQTIGVILNLSGRLPLWLATLASTRPGDASGIGDPAGDTVERFLKWESDPDRRAIAVAAALPRALNQDVLAALAPDGQAAELFAWLRGLPFVTQHGGIWRYHEVARAAMLRLQRAQAPSEWRARHAALAGVHASWAAEAAGSTGETWANPAWIDHTREEAYHLLCGDPVNALPKTLASAVKAAQHSTIRARQWAGLITDAGRDTDEPTLRERGRLLSNSIHDSDITSYLTHLIASGQLDKSSLILALRERGNSHRLAGRYDQALADLNRITEIDASYAPAVASRGLMHHTMDQYDEALADFDRAISMEPGYAWAFSNRGRVYWTLGRYDDAIADFTRAIELNPRYAKALGSRGLGYLAMARYDEALEDLDRAIGIDPDYAWALARRGQANLALGRYDDAIADFTRAIDIDISPSRAWIIASRGQAYQAVGQNDKSRADFIRAAELHPEIAITNGL
jgi:tetratricopeptide (TPR) repeat protein